MSFILDLVNQERKEPRCQLFLPGLKDVKINKVEICEHSIHLYVEMPVKPHRRPRCGTEGRKIHFRVQKIRYFKWFERTTVLFYRKRRSVCQTCGKRFAEENPFAWAISAVFQRVEPGRECAEHSCQNVQRPGFPVRGLGFDGDPAFWCGGQEGITRTSAGWTAVFFFGSILFVGV